MALELIIFILAFLIGENLNQTIKIACYLTFVVFVGVTIAYLIKRWRFGKLSQQ
jgi:uncharacterized membrane protein (DUF4010 family)